jgi:hypothetical protein
MAEHGLEGRPGGIERGLEAVGHLFLIAARATTCNRGRNIFPLPQVVLSRFRQRHGPIQSIELLQERPS